MKNDQLVLNKTNILKNANSNKSEFGGLEDLSKTLVREYLQKNITERNIALKHFINDLERQIIHFALGISNGNQKIASRILGVKETSLCEKIKKYNLRKIKKKVPLNLDMLNMEEEEISPDLFL